MMQGDTIYYEYMGKIEKGIILLAWDDFQRYKIRGYDKKCFVASKLEIFDTKAGCIESMIKEKEDQISKTKEEINELEAMLK